MLYTHDILCKYPFLPCSHMETNAYKSGNENINMKTFKLYVYMHESE